MKENWNSRVDLLVKWLEQDFCQNFALAEINVNSDVSDFCGNEKVAKY